MRGGGWDRRLDRISSGIYERTVRLHREQHRQLVRRAAMLQLQEKLAELKEGIKVSRRYLNNLSGGFAGESVRA